MIHRFTPLKHAAYGSDNITGTVTKMQCHSSTLIYSYAHISNQYIKNESQTFQVIAYHGIILQIIGESNRIPEIL